MKLLVGSRKGLFQIERRAGDWHIRDPHFLGVPSTNALRDARDGSLWALTDHGHWGAKLYVSRDDGKKWDELKCPAFPEGYEIDAVTEFGHRKEPASVKTLYTMVPNGPAGHYLIGCDPGGLFATADAGETWTLNDPLWTIRNEHNWFEGGGGVMLHAIDIDPRNPDRIHVAVSCGGVYETMDGGKSWEPRNKGVVVDFLPEQYPVYGQDTHMLRRGTQSSDVLWQQNHCGNMRSTDGGRNWEDVTEGLPSKIGFAITLDEADDNVAWTVPMFSDEQRIAPGGALVACRSDDGGKTWRELRNGLPQSHCYDIVYRHAMDSRGDFVAFGTTCGHLFATDDRGESWYVIAAHLPPISSVAIDGA
ncbi:MAG: WD40/YVTN/BNR-like repeat-containing protein [Planctomycetota bacterium]